MKRGWAILVIIVIGAVLWQIINVINVGAALWTFGIFDGSNSGDASNSGDGKPIGLSFNVYSSQLTAAGAFNLKVGAWENITVSNVSVTLNGQTKVSDSALTQCGSISNGTAWFSNAEKTIACTGFTGLTSGTTYRTQITIVYSDNAGFTITDRGVYNPTAVGAGKGPTQYPR